VVILIRLGNDLLPGCDQVCVQGACHDWNLTPSAIVA
jgi:hypothetical protein